MVYSSAADSMAYLKLLHWSQHRKIPQLDRYQVTKKQVN